jgi:DegV family protein with EDD domain
VVLVIKIVTDSASDIPSEVTRELGITVVPLYVYFGNTALKDGIDIEPDALYQRLAESPVYPTTTQPAPADFARTYSELSKEADGIVSIHISNKMSGTYNSALQGAEIAKSTCQIHVADSLSVSVGLGIVAMAAARVAKVGGTMVEVVNETKKAIRQSQIRGVLDSLRSLLKSGRITRARALVGTLLNVKPILTAHDGEIVQIGMARSYSKGVDQLFDFVKKIGALQEVAISHTTVPGEAGILKNRIASLIDEKRIQMCRIGAALGVHGGPGTLLVAARSGEST